MALTVYDFISTYPSMIYLCIYLECEHLAYGHHVGGECTGLIRADDTGATKGFNRGQRSKNVYIEII